MPKVAINPRRDHRADDAGRIIDRGIARQGRGDMLRLHQVWNHREPRRRCIGHGNAKDECQEK